MTEPHYGAKIHKAVQGRASLDGMRKSFRTIEDRQKENADRFPDLQARKDRLRKTKESSVGDEKLLAKAISVLRENGLRVAMAKTPAAAVRMVLEELKGYDLVVKSKSNVTKELHLAEQLSEAGIETVETDLGDRIVQLAKCDAAHPTGPACHLTRGEISALFSEHFGRSVSEDPMELTKVMREEIADFISKARVGITGANAIAAAEGAVVIVHNEGNAAKCAMLPDKHIIITTPEKIVPDLDEAINVTKLQTYLSTGKIISSYINIITGPSYTADIEKKVYKGMHGPKEVLVLLVDDGRLEASDKEPQYCIGCGMCLLRCPSYNVVGPIFGTAGHMGGIGVYLEGSRGNVKESLDSGLYLCTSCGACTEVCPSKIDTKKGLISIRERTCGIENSRLKEHAAVIASVKNYDNPWQVPRKQKGRWADDLSLPTKGEVLYFAGCSTSLLFPETAKKAARLIRATGCEPAYLGQNERCCGSTARKLGESDLARAKVEECFKDFKRAGAKTVVTSCPGCSSALSHFPEMSQEYGIEVVHISKFLDRHIDSLNISKSPISGTITYHDPCDLGRAQNIYDEPRRLISKATGRKAVEMERSREQSACCGSGSGVKSAFTDLAAAIGLDRISMARAVGADMIVTACPWCVQNLRDCQGDSVSVEVMDLVDLLESRLTGDRPRRSRSS